MKEQKKLPYRTKYNAKNSTNMLCEALEDEIVIEKLKGLWNSWSRNKNADLYEDFKEKKTKLKAAKNEINKLNEELEKLKNMTRELKAENAIIEVIRKQKDDLLKANDQFKFTVQKMQRETNILSDNTARLERKNKELETQNDALRKLEIDLDESNQRLESKQKQNQELETLLDEKEKQIINLKNNVRKPAYLFESYRRLPENIRENLRNSLSDESMEKFLFTGVQKDNIASLWDYMKDQVFKDKKVTELFEIFDYFLNAYNSIFQSPRYQLQEVNIDDEYDQELHLRKNTDTGNISKILLRGYKNVRMGSIEKKSIVLI